MAGSDPEAQFHLAVDASQTAIGGVLFQLHSTPAGTKATAKFGGQERVNLFLSYQQSPRLASKRTKVPWTCVRFNLCDLAFTIKHFLLSIKNRA